MKKLITKGLIVLFCTITYQLYAQPDGTLDTSYHPRYVSGTTIESLCYPDGGTTIAVQKSDGKTIYAGLLRARAADANATNFLIRINPDGSYDKDFDQNLPASFSGARGTSVALQEDDGKEKILFSTNTSFFRFNPDGTTDASFKADRTSAIWNITVQPTDQKILICIDAAPYLFRLNQDGTFDNSFNGNLPKFSGRVFVTLPQKDGKIIVAGSFKSVPGSPSSCIVRLNEDGTIDNTFNPTGEGLNIPAFNSWQHRILGLAQQNDGKYLVVGGKFNTYNGVSLNTGIIRLNTDGTLDNTFNQGQASGSTGTLSFQNVTGGSVTEAIVLPDDKIIIVGPFEKYNEISSPGIARLTKDGILDQSFETGTGCATWSGTQSPAFHVAMETDSTIVISGQQLLYNGDTAYAIARIKNSVRPQAAINTITDIKLEPAESSYCKDAKIKIDYKASGSYNSGNQFTAQLSDASGSFSNPINIGAASGTSSTVIEAQLPGNIASGSKYRIRIVSSDPVVTGEDNGKDFSINTTMPVVNPSASATTICEGQSVTLNGNSGTSIGPKTDYIWDNGVENNKAFIPTGTGSKTYTVTGKVGACTKTGQITITVNPLPKITASASPAVVCEGDKTTLKGSGGTKYEWDNSVSDGVAFEAKRTLTYTVKGTDDKGCSNEAKVTVTVNPLPKISAKATPDAVCAGGQVTLKADGGTTYSWSNGVTDNVPFIPSSSTTYTVKGTDTKGCTNEAKVDVTVNPLPKVTASATPEVVCAGKQTTLTGGGAATYTWDNNVQDNTPFTPSQTQTYTVIGKDVNNCTGEAEITITVKDTFEVSIEETICKGGNYSLGSQTLTETGIYRETFIAANGCDSTVILELQVNSPDISLTVTDNGLSAAEGMDSYQWIDCDNGNQLIQNANAQAYVPEKTGNYAVIVNKDGCRDTSTCYLYQATGVEEVNTIDNNISIYPNPVDGQLNIKTAKPLTQAHISLTNIIGQSKIINPDFSGDSFTIDMTGLANGVYIIEIKENSKVYKSKIVKK